MELSDHPVCYMTIFRYFIVERALALGVAQYRVGAYQEAVQTLTHSDQLHAATEYQSDPSDLAFLAMAYFGLGQKEKAQDNFKRFQEAKKKPRSNTELAGVVNSRREAEALLLPQPDKSKSENGSAPSSHMP